MNTAVTVTTIYTTTNDIMCDTFQYNSVFLKLQAIKMSVFLEYSGTSLTMSCGTQWVKTRPNKIQQCFLPKIIAQLLKRNHRYYCEPLHRSYFSVEETTHQLRRTGLYFWQNMNSKGTVLHWAVRLATLVSLVSKFIAHDVKQKKKQMLNFFTARSVDYLI